MEDEEKLGHVLERPGASAIGASKIDLACVAAVKAKRQAPASA